MFKKLSIALIGLVGLTVTACANNVQQKQNKASDSEPKVLVAYFSATGTTKALAERISKIANGVLFEIEPEVPYSEEDLDGWNDSARGTLESKDRTTRPAVKSHLDNFAQFDTIFLGFPIWWYTAPTIVNTFLDQYDTSGKTIIPFATSGGSNYGETEKDLKVSAPEASFLPGMVLNNVSDQELKDWIKSVK